MMRLATRIDGPLMRLSAGRVRLSFVIPVLLLHCTGARSGKQRTLPLLYVPLAEDPDAVLLIASNAGQDRHPAWYYNLRAHPEVRCELGGEKRNYSAQLLEGEARRIGFETAVCLYPGYRRYAQRCEREIGVFRLELQITY